MRSYVTFLTGFGAVVASILLAKTCPAKCGDCHRCAATAAQAAMPLMAVAGAMAVSHGMVKNDRPKAQPGKTY